MSSVGLSKNACVAVMEKFGTEGRPCVCVCPAIDGCVFECVCLGMLECGCKCVCLFMHVLILKSDCWDVQPETKPVFELRLNPTERDIHLLKHCCETYVPYSHAYILHTSFCIL